MNYQIFSQSGSYHSLSFDEHPLPSHFQEHTHTKVELLLLLEGDAEMDVCGENYPLLRNHVLIIPQGLPHRLRPKSSSPYLRAVFNLQPSYVEELGLSDLTRRFCSDGVRTIDLSGSPFLQTLLLYSRHIVSAPQLQQRSFFDERVTSLYLALLSAQSAQSQSSADSLADRAIRYINNSLDGKLTIESIADALYTSPSYLCKAFRRRTGTPMMRYVNRLRIQLAQSLLLDGTPLKEIYRQCGYENYVTFFRVFREETGKAPSEFLRDR